MTKMSHMLSTLNKNKGFQYDFFAEEWSYECGACGEELYAPTKKHLEGNFWIHTHSNNCIGGW
jgi:hypothetical protein